MGNEISVNEFSEIVREFASYKLGIQGCSSKTVDEYLLDLRTFFRFLLAKERGIPTDSEDFLQIDVRAVDFPFISQMTPDGFFTVGRRILNISDWEFRSPLQY